MATTNKALSNYAKELIARHMNHLSEDFIAETFNTSKSTVRRLFDAHPMIKENRKREKELLRNAKLTDDGFMKMTNSGSFSMTDAKGNELLPHIGAERARRSFDRLGRTYDEKRNTMRPDLAELRPGSAGYEREELRMQVDAAEATQRQAALHKLGDDATEEQIEAQIAFYNAEYERVSGEKPPKMRERLNGRMTSGLSPKEKQRAEVIEWLEQNEQEGIVI